MKRYFLATAFAAALAAPALSISGTSGPWAGAASNPFPMHGSYRSVPPSRAIEASQLIGAGVFVPGAAPDAPVSDIRSSWIDVGAVRDLRLTRDGQIASALVDLAGVFGTGNGTVELPMHHLEIVSEIDGTGWFIAIPAGWAVLDAAPLVSAGPVMPAPNAGPARIPGEGRAAARHASWPENATTPVIPASAPGDGLPDDALTVGRLFDAPVHDGTNRRVGTVERLVLSRAGAVTSAIIGLGADSVTIPFEALEIGQDESGGLRATVARSGQEVADMPAIRD